MLLLTILFEFFNNVTWYTFVKSYCQWEILCSFCRCETLQNRLKTKSNLHEMWGFFLFLSSLFPNESWAWVRKWPVQMAGTMYCYLLPCHSIGLNHFKAKMPYRRWITIWLSISLGPNTTWGLDLPGIRTTCAHTTHHDLHPGTSATHRNSNKRAFIKVMRAFGWQRQGWRTRNKEGDHKLES